MLCDSLGRPLRLLLTAGQKADCQSAPELLQDQPARAVVADKGYDTDSIRAFIREELDGSVLQDLLHLLYPKVVFGKF